MDRLPHLDRALDELDPPRWAPPAADATHLVRTVHAARRLPLGELGPVESRLLVSQQVALPYVLPLAVRLPLAEPLFDALFSPASPRATCCSPPSASPRRPGRRCRTWPLSRAPWSRRCRGRRSPNCPGARPSDSPASPRHPPHQADPVADRPRRRPLGRGSGGAGRGPPPPGGGGPAPPSGRKGPRSGRPST
ncbi:contact-dependent growth inhibition system immunity protein [Streptomyces buecherae]|uniref:contact-dependent growth inhibition system immunity protein n=1 Tax=Streptomyces buecherae TaxID=2763006 RepID=UPI00364B55C5